jgi:hypothetical protein
MGKTLVYIVLLAILGTGVYYFLFRENNGLYAEKEANFTIRDTNAIGKIFLVENDGKSILLERGANNQWTLNKQYPAMRIQVLNILTCMRLQTAMIPASEREHDRVVKLLAGMGTKVEVYDRQGKKIRSFFVAGQGPNYHGSYMILENGSQPYLVEIPNFEGYLTPIYTTDPAEWRSRLVFQAPPKELQSVSVTYPYEPLNSFTLDNSGTEPKVILTPELQPSFTELNMGRVRQYMDFFAEVNAEGYLNGAIGMDTVIRDTRLRCKISVTTKKGNTTALDIYWKNLTDHGRDLVDQTSTDPMHRPKDVERYYAVNQASHDTLLIQALSFEKMFRLGYEFYQKEGDNQAQPNPSPVNDKKAPINYVK